MLLKALCSGDRLIFQSDVSKQAPGHKRAAETCFIIRRLTRKPDKRVKLAGTGLPGTRQNVQGHGHLAPAGRLRHMTAEPR